jgi:hypothetical protein
VYKFLKIASRKLDKIDDVEEDLRRWILLTNAVSIAQNQSGISLEDLSSSSDDDDDVVQINLDFSYTAGKDAKNRVAVVSENFNNPFSASISYGNSEDATSWNRSYEGEDTQSQEQREQLLKQIFDSIEMDDEAPPPKRRKLEEGEENGSERRSEQRQIYDSGVSESRGLD